MVLMGLSIFVGSMFSFDSSTVSLRFLLVAMFFLVLCAVLLADFLDLAGLYRINPTILSSSLVVERLFLPSVYII